MIHNNQFAKNGKKMRQMAQRNIFSLRLPHLGFRPKFNFWFQRPCQLLFLKKFIGKGQLCMGSLFHITLNKLCWTKRKTSWLQRRVLLQCSVWRDRCVSFDKNDQLSRKRICSTTPWQRNLSRLLLHCSVEGKTVDSGLCPGTDCHSCTHPRFHHSHHHQ